MRYRELGNAGIKVSEIGFGTWAIGGLDWGKVDDRVSIEGIQRAVDIGITFFDTANVYGEGHSEELLGEALKGKRDKVVIATKGGMLPGRGALDFSPASLNRAIEGSLKRLGTDYVDLYQLHNADPEVVREGQALNALERMKSAGMIREWGLSLRPPAHHWKVPASGASADPVTEALEILEDHRPATLQLVFNIFERDAAGRLFDRAKELGVAILARVPLASGMLSGKFTSETRFPDDDFRSRWPRDLFLEDIQRVDELKRTFQGSSMTLTQGALAFTLSFDAVAATIVGAKTARQIEENAAAAEHAPLSQDLLRKISSAM